jgi:hypothetical protein
MRVTEGDLHELARLFMDQFSFKRDMSLDEFLSEYREKLTDDERNLGYCILQLFHETV